MKYINILIAVLLTSCGSQYYTRQTYEYPKPIDTGNKTIVCQKPHIYQADNVFVDNNFDGARMNNFKQINDTLFQILITPENIPINPSPWYAFKIWSKYDKDIYIELKYKHAKHRYTPKISSDRKNWKNIESLFFGVDSVSVSFPVHLNKKTRWIAAQKIINSSDVNQWIDSLKNKTFFKETMSVGNSVLGRKIPYFRIGKGSSDNKKVIVLLSRQHPPEVTGFEAMQFFIDELFQKNKLTEKFFETYDVWVFPLLNPDGVDLGHWRHNANGVDLNRDWAYFRQPEINAITHFILNKAKKKGNKIVLGIDFHSTFKDVFYVFDDSFHSVIPDFNKYWTTSINRLVFPFFTKTSSYGATQPISKNWFYMQFKAEGITYEIGDNTSDEIIEKKSRAAAVSMMDLLLN